MIKKRISLLSLFFIAICALAVFVCLQTVAAFGVRAAETAGQETVNDFYCRRFDVYPLTEDEASITDPVGKSAVAENGELLLAQVGTYNIVYASGRVERVHVYSYLPETVFTLSENLEREYAAGDYLYIPVATATNEIETTDNCFVLVEKDGAEYCSYDSYTEEKRLDLSSAGEYEVTYGYLDVFGYITTQTYSFTVADKPVIVLPDISVFYLGEEYPMDAYAYAGGAEYAATCRVTDPLGKRAVVQTISADTIGEYVLEFTATVDGQELVRSCTIPCVEKPERLFQGDKFTVRQRSDVPLFPYSLQEGTGVELVGFASGAEFEYIHSVDMNGLTADENMISFQAASGDGYGALNAVEVTVTDAYDENNSFSVFFWQCPWVANYVYASVGYRGQYAGVCNEWYDGKEHYNELRYDYYLYPEYCYGAILMNHSLTGQGLTRLNDLSVQFDYASGKVYVTNKEGRYLLRDLGDPAHVGEGNEFEGFTYGKANITITLHEMLGRNAGVVVYELMGETLSGQTLVDGTGPDVVLELPGEDMADLPSGVAGYAYDLPAVYATDNFSYIRSQEIVAKLNGAEQDGLIRDGKFYPNTVTYFYGHK